MESLKSVPGCMCDAAKETNNVLRRPVIGGADTVHLFLATGIVVVAVIIWSRILAHIQG